MFNKSEIIVYWYSKQFQAGSWFNFYVSNNDSHIVHYIYVPSVEVRYLSKFPWRKFELYQLEATSALTVRLAWTSVKLLLIS